MLAGSSCTRPRRWGAAAWPWALLASLLLPKVAEAAALRADVNVHGTADEVRELETTLRSLFPPDSQLRVSAVDAVDGAQVMRESFTPSASDVVARAWIELHEGKRVTIYVADVSGERILVRHLPRNDDDGELVREATARIVATALEALLSGAQIGVGKEQATQELTGPAPLPLPRVPPPASTASEPGAVTSFTLGAQYGLQLFSRQIPLVHGPGLALGLSRGAHATRAGAALVGQLWWPTTAEDSVAKVRVYSGALRLLATVERSFSGSVVLSAGFGGGIDVIRVEPAVATLAVPVELAAPTTLTTPALRASLSARFRPSPGFSLYTTCALDGDPSGTRYVSSNEGVATEILKPHVLRPSLVVGVATP